MTYVLPYNLDSARTPDLTPDQIAYYRTVLRATTEARVRGIETYLANLLGPIDARYERPISTVVALGETLAQPSGALPAGTVLTALQIEDLLNQDPPIEEVIIKTFILRAGELAYRQAVYEEDRAQAADQGAVCSGIDAVVTGVCGNETEPMDATTLGALLDETQVYPNRFFPLTTGLARPLDLPVFMGGLGDGSGGLFGLLQDDQEILAEQWNVGVSPEEDWREIVDQENVILNGLVGTALPALITALTTKFPAGEFATAVAYLTALQADLDALLAQNADDLTTYTTWRLLPNHPQKMARIAALDALDAAGNIVADVLSRIVGQDRIYNTRWYWFTRLVHRMFGSYPRWKALAGIAAAQQEELAHHQTLLRYIDGL